MPLSMTGCGDGVATEGSSACRAEVRSVNNRFLKVSLRAREGFGLLESRVEAGAAGPLISSVTCTAPRRTCPRTSASTRDSRSSASASGSAWGGSSSSRG